MEKIIRFGIFVISFMLVTSLIHKVTIQKFSSLEDTEARASTMIITAKDRERQLDCLAKNIYYEAGGESFEGKVGVAQVTMNRSESSRFPKDICGVVYQKTIFMEKIVCQFSWYCQNSGKSLIKNQTAYNESMEVAKKVLLEGFRLDALKKAMYYHADYVNPGWGKPVITKIGSHIFYKE